MGAGCWENRPCDENVGAFSPMPWSSGRKEGLEMEFSQKKPVLSSGMPVNEASTKTQKEGIWRASGLVSI